MSLSIDSILSSSLIVWVVIIFGIIHLYLKKTGKTFKEMIDGITEFFKGYQQ